MDQFPPGRKARWMLGNSLPSSSQLFDNPDVDVILSATGGDFLYEILPYLNSKEIIKKINEHPKLFQGYSDNTALVHFLTTKCDIPTLYGADFGDFGMNDWDIAVERNLEVLQGKRLEQESFEKYQGMFPHQETGLEGYELENNVEWKVLTGEKATMRGRCVGGCVDVLANIAGTQYDGAAEFVEKYKKDGIIWYFESFALNYDGLMHALWKFEQLGWFENVKGFVFGRPMFYEEKDYAGNPLPQYQDVLLERLKKYNVPIVMDADIGHHAPQVTMINGMVADIEVEKGKGKIKFTSEKILNKDLDKSFKNKDNIKESGNINNYTEALTHAGTFHADDVFATAFLKHLWPDIKIARGFGVPENYNGLVFDIGNGKFDHHQLNNEVRPNGVPYASLGKLWREFAPEKYSQFVVDYIDENFIQQIDLTDNTGEPNTLSRTISAFNPSWDSAESADKKFAEAVRFAYPILMNEIENAKSIEKAINIVKEDVEKSPSKDVIVLNQFVPWQDYIVENVPDAKFVIFPSNRGGYNIQTVPSDEDPMKGRVPFPEQWLGNPDASLGMTFCHPGNFLAACGTKEEAINIANIAIREFEKNKELETLKTTQDEYLCDKVKNKINPLEPKHSKTFEEGKIDPNKDDPIK